MPKPADKIFAAPFLKAPSFGSAVYNVASLKNFFKAKNGKYKSNFSKNSLKSLLPFKARL